MVIMLDVQPLAKPVTYASIISGTGATVDNSTSLSWECVNKISCSWVGMLIFYVLLFGVVYMM
jgi:hypothetical protein